MNFRLLLIWKPLHYKIIVTKGRLHLFLMSSCMSLGMIMATVHLQQPYEVWRNHCYFSFILQQTAYYTIIIVTSVVLTIVMTGACLTLFVLLRRRENTSINGPDSFQSNSSEMMLKLTKATALTLGIYMMLQDTALIVDFIVSFPQFRETVGDILSDYMYILLYINNMINPFIYYFTLKDFQEGYRQFCNCFKPSVGETCQHLSHTTVSQCK